MPIPAFQFEGDYVCGRCIQPFIQRPDADEWENEVIEVELEQKDGPVLCAHCGRSLVELPETL